MLELVFTISLSMIVVLYLYKKSAISSFLILSIGANPYIVALFAALMVAIHHLKHMRIGTDFLVFLFVWVGVGSWISLISGGHVLISEVVQVVLGILFSSFVRFYMSHKKINIIDSLFWSGFVLASFEVILCITDFDLNTRSYIGSIPENYTAYYIVLSVILPVLFIYPIRIWSIAIFGLSFVAIEANESRGGVLLVLFLLLYRGWEFKKARMFAILILPAIVSYFIFSTMAIDSYGSQSILSVFDFERNFSNSERLMLLKLSFDLFLENYVGHGLGSSYALMVNNSYTVNAHYPHPHNTLAFMMVELGVVGIFIYFLYVYNIFKSALSTKDVKTRQYKFALLSCVLFVSMVDVLFYNGIFTLFFWLVYAIATEKNRKGI